MAALLADRMSWLLLLGAAFAAAFTAYLVVLSDTPVPYMDQWWFINQLRESHGHYRWDQLWAQHNEHRPAVPRLFYLIDYYGGAGRNRFLLASIFLVQLLHAALLAWIARRWAGLTGPAWRTAAALALFCLFLPTQRENLLWGFQICFTLPFFCVTIAIAGVQAAHRRSRPAFLTLSIAAALCATLSLVSGLLLWPLLCIQLGMLRRYRWLAAMALSGAIVSGLYLVGYRTPPGSGGPWANLHRVPELLLFLGHHLAGSFEFLAPAVALALTAAAVVGVTVQYLRLAGKGSSPYHVTVVTLSAFCLATACLTAVGRLQAGLSSRYQTPALLFWCGLGLALLAAVPRALLPIQLLLAGLMLAASTQIAPVRDEVRFRADALAIGGAAIAADVDDRESLARLNMPDDFILRNGEFLRAERKALFAVDPEREIGEQVSAHYRMAASRRCGGRWDTLTPVSRGDWPGALAMGWAWDQERSRPVHELLLAANGRITGFATTDSPLRSHGREMGGSLESATWRGFVPYSAGGPATVAAYAILDNHTVCELPGRRTVPASGLP